MASALPSLQAAEILVPHDVGFQLETAKMVRYDPATHDVVIHLGWT